MLTNVYTKVTRYRDYEREEPVDITNRLCRLIATDPTWVVLFPIAEAVDDIWSVTINMM